MNTTETTESPNAERLNEIFKYYNNTLDNDQKRYFFACFFGFIEQELKTDSTLSLDTFEVGIRCATNFVKKSYTKNDQ